MARWAIGAGLLVALVWAGSRLARVEVAGDSMRPTLEPGDRLLVWRTRRVDPGRLVVVADPRDRSRILVKRAVRVVGDEVEAVGDNPAASTDSRVFGAVSRRAVQGRALYRYHPPSAVGRVR